MDGDLNRLKGISNGAEFLQMLNAVMDSELTGDFWGTTLPSALATSSARNPELFAFVAAQNRLDAPVLFSHKKISELLDPSLQPKKQPLDRHHLFPRGWLDNQGIIDLRIVNQMANLTLLEWSDDIAISDAPPCEYVPKYRPLFSATEWRRMQDLHALPDGWEQLGYEEFLQERRRLMAALIRRGYETLL
jgi:hypothetical protein